MNRNSNTYTLVYATILVVVVAAVLSFAAIYLKPQQQANVLIEKMGAILTSIGEAKEVADAPDKDTYIETEFEKYIKHTYVVNAEGVLREDSVKTVLALLDKLPEVFATGAELPLFEAQLNDGKKLYIIPVIGKGLWGTVWGYVALNEDCNTIYGVKIDHEKETPGLGAEISTPAFSNQFIGKKIFADTTFVSIDITKGAGSSRGNIHAVDAITGGTLTTNGVEAMLAKCLKYYVPFFETKQPKPIQEIESVPAILVKSDAK